MGVHVEWNDRMSNLKVRGSHVHHHINKVLSRYTSCRRRSHPASIEQSLTNISIATTIQRRLHTKLTIDKHIWLEDLV